MSQEDSIQRIITEKLLGHGYVESNKKPGLFYKANEIVKLFIDMRGSRTKYYGFTVKHNSVLDEEEGKEHFGKIRKELAAVGVEDVTRFDEHEWKSSPPEIVTCPKCEKVFCDHYKDWIYCPFCGLELIKNVDEGFF